FAIAASTIVSTAYAQDTPTEAAQAAHECDMLAASPLDPERPPGVPGVRLENIRDPNRAVIVCRIAERNNPSPHYSATFAIAMDAAGAKEAAMRQYWYATRNGNAFAQHLLGTAFDRAKRYDQAYEWYLKSARQGFPPAMTDVGALYYSGLGTAKNVSEAI